MFSASRLGPAIPVEQNSGLLAGPGCGGRQPGSAMPFSLFFTGPVPESSWEIAPAPPLHSNKRIREP